MFLVELETGVYLAPWPGDPGRTLVRVKAKKYKTEAAAKRALTLIRKNCLRQFTTARIQNYEVPF